MPNQIVLVHCSDKLLHVFHADEEGEPVLGAVGEPVPVCGAEVVRELRLRRSDDDVCDNCAAWALLWARGHAPSA